MVACSRRDGLGAPLVLLQRGSQSPVQVGRQAVGQEENDEEDVTELIRNRSGPVLLLARLVSLAVIELASQLAHLFYQPDVLGEVGPVAAALADPGIDQPLGLSDRGAARVGRPAPGGHSLGRRWCSLSASSKRSPTSCSRSPMLRLVQRLAPSSGSSRSAQPIGAETGAPGTGRALYGPARVLLMTF